MHIIPASSFEENFLLINPETDEIVLQLGPNIHKQVSPCSTFKIALSLIGFDTGILKDEISPIWDFQEGFIAYMESWKTSQTPQSWMTNSCIWYSQILAEKLGMELIETYLKSFEYGNQDMSGGLTNAWLGSSLKISPAEQVQFLQRMLQEKLPLKPYSIEELAPKRGRVSPTANEQQVPCCKLQDSSANSAVNGRERPRLRSSSSSNDKIPSFPGRVGRRMETLWKNRPLLVHRRNWMVRGLDRKRQHVLPFCL